jgi:hypothetical protein
MSTFYWHGSNYNAAQCITYDTNIRYSMQKEWLFYFLVKKILINETCWNCCKKGWIEEWGWMTDRINSIKIHRKHMF